MLTHYSCLMCFFQSTAVQRAIKSWMVLVCIFNATVAFGVKQGSGAPHFNLFDLDNQEAEFLTVKQVDLKVSALGDSAITEVSYVIHNSDSREKEAMFQLALPPSAKVIGYALDIEGHMVDGVIVPKEHARQAFNEIEDEGIDPGIAEIIKGNRFQTEVYPVMPRQSRKVKVVYIESLNQRSNGEYQYRFPFSSYPEKVLLSLDINIEGVKQPPRILALPGKNMAHHDLKKKKDRYQLEIDRYWGRGFSTPYEDLIFTYKPSNLNLIGEDSKGLKYFSATVPVHRQSITFEPIQPKHLSIFWDTSSSMELQHRRNKMLLERILSSDAYKQIQSINITSFSNTIVNEWTFSGGENLKQEVLGVVDSMLYDGATRYQAIGEKLKSMKGDVAFIFSDGANSLGDFSIPALPAPVHFLASGSINEPFAKAIARISKGMYFNIYKHRLDEVTQWAAYRAPDIAVTPRNQNPLSDVELEFIPGISPRVSVSGRLSKKKGRIDIWVNNQLLERVNLRKLKVRDSDIPKQKWAAMKLNVLLVYENKADITKFGMTYGIVTPYTSLIVLESLGQYAEYGIDPPEYFKQLKNFKKNWKEELEWAAENKAEEKEQQSIQKQQVLEYWRERIDWWYEAKKVSLEEASERIARRLEDTDGEEIIVTGIRASLERSFGSVQRTARGVVDAISSEDIGVFSDQMLGKSLMALGRYKIEDPEIKISLNVSGVNSDYIKAISNLPDEEKYAAYLKLKRLHGDKPGFFMDMAHYFFLKNQPIVAIRILTNILELYPEMADMSRMVAYKFVEMENYDLAIEILNDVKVLLPYEPVSYRDLAKAWEKKAAFSESPQAYIKTMDFYWQAVTQRNKTYDETLPITALTELNRLVVQAEKKGIHIPKMDKRFIQNLDMDLRISMSWNNRMVDLDLWVIEPTGEKVYYGNTESASGAIIPSDNTFGYGPEEYLSKFSIPGEYQIQANYYANGSVELIGPTTLTLNIYSNYGRKNETVETITVRLDQEEQVVNVGKFVVN